MNTPLTRVVVDLLNSLFYFFLFHSGGHLNPAVTLAMTIVRGLQPIILAPLYVLAQLLGAIIGAALARVYTVLVFVVTAQKIYI
jgi:glycerol uptake facilitator-like aquaporin